jgi:hypothetical protein
VNRHKAKSISSIAVPDVIPKIRSSRARLFCPWGCNDELAFSEEPLALACNASRYLWPTGVRMRPLGAGITFIVLAIPIVSQLE